MTYEALFEEIVEWQGQTFPNATPDSVVEHLFREVLELKDEPLNQGEIADCMFLLVGLAGRFGIDLKAVMVRKFEINKAREWGPPDAQGVVEHVRATPAHFGDSRELIGELNGRPVNSRGEFINSREHDDGYY